jgi:hypothetical protein
VLTYEERHHKGGEGASKSTRRGREKGTKWKKDVIWTERSEGIIENKGVSFFRRSKRTAFSGQKAPTKANNTAKNPPLVGHFPFRAASHEQVHP